MNYQLDTTVQIHDLLDPPNHEINSELSKLLRKAELIAASTYTKKEFAFSVIRDSCTWLTRVTRTKSLSDALDFIDKYGSSKKRFRGRILVVLCKFFIRETIKENWGTNDENTRDRIGGENLAKFLRILIPELWERFGRLANVPLQDRTKCPLAHKPPTDNGRTFDFVTKRKCRESSGCALSDLMRSERKRAIKLLARLHELEDELQTDELRKIKLVIEAFFEREDENMCYELCNQGIGDLIISLETPEDRTLLTTNAKETVVISTAIGQNHIILPHAMEH